MSKQISLCLWTFVSEWNCFCCSYQHSPLNELGWLVEDFGKNILLIPGYISFSLISLTLRHTYWQGRSTTPNASVCISVCVMTCLQLCIPVFVSTYQYVHLLNCIWFCFLVLALCENLWTHSSSPQKWTFFLGGVCIYIYMKCSFYICFAFCMFPCSCVEVLMQACFSIVVHWYLFRVVCLFPCVQFPVCVSVLPCISFPCPHLCCVQLPGFVHVRISLLLLFEGCIFNGVGAGEIVHHFALYLSSSVFPVFA